MLRPALRGSSRLTRQKKNPLVNFKAMVKLNPYAKVVRDAELAAQAARAAKKAGPKAKKAAAPGTKLTRAKGAAGAAARKQSRAIYDALVTDEFAKPVLA